MMSTRPKSTPRFKSYRLRCKLRKKMPGSFKVVSDFGYNDASTLVEYLTIDQAILELHKRRNHTNTTPFLCDLISTADINRIEYDYFDSSLQYYIVRQEREMPWEHADFDWMSS